MVINFINANSFSEVFKSWDLESFPKTAVLKDEYKDALSNIIYVSDPSLGNYTYSKGILYGNDANVDEIEQFIVDHHKDIDKMSKDIKAVREKMDFNIDEITKNREETNEDIQLLKLFHIMTATINSDYVTDLSYDNYLTSYIANVIKQVSNLEIEIQEASIKTTFSESIIVYDPENGYIYEGGIGYCVPTPGWLISEFLITNLNVIQFLYTSNGKSFMREFNKDTKMFNSWHTFEPEQSNINS